MSNKPVILHTINSLAVGGAEVLLRDTINGLPEFEHVIAYLHGPDTMLEQFQNHIVYKLNHRYWIDMIRTVPKIKKIIRDHKVRLVHAHLFDATIVTRLAVPNQIPFYFTIHNILSKDAFEVNRISAIAEKLSYKKGHTVVAVSKHALDDYNQWIGIKGRSFVLYNYVHQKYFDLNYPYDRDIQNDFRLVAVGNLRRQKNYALLLDAFNLLKDYPISLDIYGSGDLENSLREKIIADNLRVRLMGRTNDVSKILLNYDAYIMASLFEGFGIAPMEAMAAGMPVLLSDRPVFHEIAEEIPEYFDPLNLLSIAGAIKSVYNNWSLKKEKAKRGKDLIYEKASQEIYFQKLKDLYSLTP